MHDFWQAMEEQSAMQKLSKQYDKAMKGLESTQQGRKLNVKYLYILLFSFRYFTFVMIYVNTIVAKIH
jgi:hypothetical protein